MAFDASSLTDTDRKVFDWISSNLGGEVTAFARQPRWRPGWDVVVGRDGSSTPLYVRGAREGNYVAPTDLRQEAGIQRIFERHGVPAPRVFGLIDEPLALVMERLPGRINTETLEDPGARQRVRHQFIDIVAKVHAIPVTEFEPLGFRIPRGPVEIALNLYTPSEAIFRRNIGRPFPLMSFIAGWLKRNVPLHRNKIALINTDAGQFLFDDDGVTGLIDFETSAIGDPAAEFAGMRLRDSTEPLGDLSALADRYEQLTGDRLEKSVIEYHTAGFCGVNGFLMWPLLLNPEPGQDYIAYMNFSVATSRWSISAIAESIGLELETPSDPVARPMGFPEAGPQLVESVARLKADAGVDAYARDSAAALARYVQRWNAYGRDCLANDLAEVSALLGRRFDDWEESQAALDQWISAADASEDRRLTQHFHNWLRRQNFLLQGCGQASYLVGRDLQPIPQR